MATYWHIISRKAVFCVDHGLHRELDFWQWVYDVVTGLFCVAAHFRGKHVVVAPATSSRNKTAFHNNEIRKAFGTVTKSHMVSIIGGCHRMLKHKLMQPSFGACTRHLTWTESLLVSVSRGSLEQVDLLSGREGWRKWTERFEILADVPEADRHILLVNHCGLEAYRMIRRAVAPDKPTMSKGLRTSSTQFLVYAACIAFYARTQQPFERIATSMRELRYLAVPGPFE
uniref:Uncharacterized protein n=1 Tax=Trichuris muris TaxID=70415 RepID=A0A5S6QGV7_TRIMR